MHGGFVPVELDNTMSHQVVEVRREAVAPCITCPLCHKLFRDATTITECLHTFCRKCIYTKLSDEEMECCPICNIKLGCVSLEKLRPDHNLQHVRANIFPQERIKVKAPEEVTLVVALPAKRKERSLSSLVASNKLDGDALPLPQFSASYLKKKYHQPGLGGDKTKSAPAPISPLPSKVGKKDFSSSKGGKKYNLLPKDGKKDTTLSLSKKRSVPASAETAAAKKGKPSSPVMSPAALESESAPVSVNSDMPPAAAPSGLPTSSVPALTGSEAQTPKVGIRAGSASHVSLLDMSPTSCYDFVRSFATEKDKAQLQGLSRPEKQIALSYNMVQVLAFLSYSFEEETLVETKSKELAEANAKLQDSVAAHELLRDRIAIVEHDNNNLKTTIGNLQNQLKDSATAHERDKALLRDRIAIFEQDNNNLKSTIGNLQNQLKNSAAAHERDKALLGDRIAIFEQGKNNFKSTIGNLQNQLKDSATAHERQVADLNKQMHQLQEQVETPAGTTSAEAPPGPTPAPNEDSVAPTTVYFAAEQSEDTVIDLDNFFDIVGTAAERSDEETDDIYIADFGFIMEDYGTGMR